MTNRTALIVSGAGARGAYEAGAVRALFPTLTDDDAIPRILVGTSAGALNVAALAARAHLGAEGAAEQVVAAWSNTELTDVFSPVGSFVRTGGATVGRLIGLPVAPPAGLLDTSPMWAAVDTRVSFGQLHENVRTGKILAVAVATTSLATGGTVVFVEHHDDVCVPDYDVHRNIAYVSTTLTVDHVLASAAIPVLFPPVRITDAKRPEYTGWYVDGGLLLNTPIKPALALGATRIGVVASHPQERPPTPAPARDTPPDVLGVTALSLRAILTDRMIDDLLTLRAKNLEKGNAFISNVFAGPTVKESAEIDRLAEKAFDDMVGFRHRARSPVQAALTRLLGGGRPGYGELLSYMLFDSRFTAPAAEFGSTCTPQPS